jgi:hypothetical protein
MLSHELTKFLRPPLSLSPQPGGHLSILVPFSSKQASKRLLLLSVSANRLPSYACLTERNRPEHDGELDFCSASFAPPSQTDLPDLEFMEGQPDTPGDVPYPVVRRTMPVGSISCWIITSYSPSDGGPTRLVADYRAPGSGSHGLLVWNYQSGHHLAFLTLPEADATLVCAITYHNPWTGRPYIAAAYARTADGQLAVWSGDDFRLLFSKPIGPTATTQCLTAYSIPGRARDATRVVMGMADGSVVAWDGETGESLPPLEGFGSRVDALLACAAGTGEAPWLVAGGVSAGLRAFEPETGRTIWSIDTQAAGAVRSLALLEPDTGAPLFVSGGPRETNIWDLRTAALVRTLAPGGTGVLAVYREPSQGAMRIITGCWVYDAETGALLHRLAMPCESVIVYATEEGAVRVAGSENQTGELIIADPEAGRNGPPHSVPHP